MAGSFIAPELALKEDEAKDLTEALAGVNQFYSQVVDPKIIAWMGLIGVAGKIYAPRIGAIILRNKMKPQPHRVAPLRSVPQPAAPSAQAQPATQPQAPAADLKSTPMKDLLHVFSNPETVSLPGFEDL